MFEILGFNVIDTATNGEEAIIKFQKFIIKPDVISIEATRVILEIDKTAKIVIVSGDPTIKQKALASGAINFKEKTFNISELYQQIYFLKKEKKYKK